MTSSDTGHEHKEVDRVLSGWQNLTEEERRQMAAGIVKGEPGGGPWHLEIQPTNKCNVRCFFCINERYTRCSAETMIPWEKLKGLLEGRAGGNLKMVRLSGGGEPLTYPSLRPMLELMASRGIRLFELTTNGTLLKALARDLAPVGPELAAVAINEATPADYARTMRVPEKMFDQVVEGIAALKEATRGRPEGQRPTLRLQFFVHRNNWRNLKEIYRTGVALGADIVYLRTILELGPEERIPAEAHGELKSLITEVIEENYRTPGPLLELDLSQEGGLHHYADAEMRRLRPADREPMFAFQDAHPRRYYCFMPWYSALVAVDGSVYPCCMMMQRPLGNILEEPWEAIWNGERFGELRREFRQMMLLGGGMEYSRKCHPLLQEACLGSFGCQWTARLCSADFYREVAERMEKETPAGERLWARAKNQAIRWGHQLRKHTKP
jgi:MoaA/NifB/PqqE/SkfB family radical SAM enzyme